MEWLKQLYNPMIADMYEENKAAMLNCFMSGFRRTCTGLIGGLYNRSYGWYLAGCWLLCTYLLPFMAFLFWDRLSPKQQNEMDKASTSSNIKAIFTSPLYWFMLFCMVLTATTELGNTIMG